MASVRSYIKDMPFVSCKVLSVPAPNIAVQRPFRQAFKVLLDSRPLLVPRVAEVRCYFFIHLIDMLLLHICCCRSIQVIRIDLSLLALITSDLVLLGSHLSALRVTELWEPASTRLATFPQLSKG